MEEKAFDVERYSGLRVQMSLLQETYNKCKKWMEENRPGSVCSLSLPQGKEVINLSATKQSNSNEEDQNGNLRITQDNSLSKIASRNNLLNQDNGETVNVSQESAH